MSSTLYSAMDRKQKISPAAIKELHRNLEVVASPANAALLPRKDWAEYMKTSHRYLAHRYQRHGPKVEALWKSINKGQRTEALAFTADKQSYVLKLSNILASLQLDKIVPEMNLLDLVEPGDDALLVLLRNRATTTLMKQFTVSLNWCADTPIATPSR